jgi:hypothetical protein
MLKKGMIKQYGVYGPEAVVPYDNFIKELGKRKMYDYYQADEFPFFLIIDIEKKELAGVYIEHGNNMHVILFNNSEPLHDGSIYQIHFAVYTPQFVFKVLGDKVYYARIRD